MRRRIGFFVLVFLGVPALALAVGRGTGAAGPVAAARAFTEYPLPATTPATAEPATTATATATPCALAWSIVSSANPGADFNYLNGVAAVGANDVWTVGYFINGSIVQTLIEHWNGSAWAVVPSPNVGTSNNYLKGVAAVAPNDVWAVGSYNNTATTLHQTLVEHWNGSAWTVVASPNVGTSYNDLYGVAAVAANDVWAVGSYCLSYCGTSTPILQTLPEHWNGSAWIAVSSPPAGSNEVYGVAAVAANDVWAVGDSISDSDRQTLTEHWNGSAWTVVASPNPGTSGQNLHSVAAVAANDVWAVGSYIAGTTSPTLAEHWDGSAWAIVPSPNPGTASNDLIGVAAVAAGDVWAVGEGYNGSNNQTLTEHWNGSAWIVVPSPNTGTNGISLYGVAAVAANDVWAVGDYFNGSSRQTLTEHYSNSCVTPTATSTPVPTDTPSPSPSPCTISFSDVHPTDYFATPVTYLFCHGVISGYADGTFRPSSATTRNQMVKIAVLGFAKPIVTPAGGAYTFHDVPATSPFFTMIETAEAAGIVSGYACGGPGEPCDGQHRPYFRPNAPVTRGQLAKIAVAAAGWPVLDPAVATFADVAPGSVFYRFVETAACHGVVSGSACGGPSEPCDAQHRPYFRPNSNATRGQIAKIVYLALSAAGACPPTAPR